jgi:[acyl-carrier-protein] S-malonyltransferase
MKAFVFPGQGSQFVGMAKEHYDQNSNVRELFDQADEILGFSLTNIMFDGPEDTLKQTEYTQAAIYLHSIALYMDQGETPSCVAGHSLGEFTALTAAGVLSFEQGLELVRKRGVLMQSAGEKMDGTMAAIIGLDDEKVEELCHNISTGENLIVAAANFNSTGQVVISGSTKGVEMVVELAKSEGARMAMLLPVSGAFHSELMKPAFEDFKEFLSEIPFNDAKVPVYSNVDATASQSAGELKEKVLQQLISPVRWTQTIRNMMADGVTDLVEIGPGKVLQGLAKRIERSLNTQGIQ